MVKQPTGPGVARPVPTPALPPSTSSSAWSKIVASSFWPVALQSAGGKIGV